MIAVFYQSGPFYGVKLAIESVQRLGGCDVVLITDQDDLFFPHVEVIPSSNFKILSRLRRIYHHHGLLPVEFSFNTIAEWLVISEWLDKSGHQGPVVTLDTDVLTFSHLEEAFLPFTGDDLAISIVIAPQSPTLISNHQVLHDFVEMVCSLYEDESKWSIFCNWPNVTGLSLWYHFRATIGRRYSYGNPAEIIGGTTFSYNICLPRDGFEHDGISKVMHFYKGQPYCHSHSCGRVRFHTLHCWGAWKQRMQELMDMSMNSRLDV